MTQVLEQSLVSTQELADRLGVHEDLIRRLARAGRIPFARVGDRLMRFSVVDVLQALRGPERRHA